MPDSAHETAREPIAPRRPLERPTPGQPPGRTVIRLADLVHSPDERPGPASPASDPVPLVAPTSRRYTGNIVVVAAVLLLLCLIGLAAATAAAGGRGATVGTIVEPPTPAVEPHRPGHPPAPTPPPPAHPGP